MVHVSQQQDTPARAGHDEIPRRGEQTLPLLHNTRSRRRSQATSRNRRHRAREVRPSLIDRICFGCVVEVQCKTTFLLLGLARES